MARTPREMHDAVLRNLPAKTGRTAEQWLELVDKRGPAGTKEQIAWLKSEHQLGTVTAHMILAARTGALAAYENPEALVDNQYSADRAALRPIYERLTKEARKLGRDIRLEPCKTYVPVMRKYQFAVIKPTTRTRVDLGLALPGEKPTARLEVAKGLGGGDRITHRIGLTSPKEIDADVIGWFKQAYARAKA